MSTPDVIKTYTVGFNELIQLPLNHNVLGVVYNDSCEQMSIDIIVLSPSSGQSMHQYFKFYVKGNDDFEPGTPIKKFVGTIVDNEKRLWAVWETVEQSLGMVLE